MKKPSFRTRQTLIAALSGFVAVSTLIIASIGAKNGAGSGQLGTNMVGRGYFKAFTIDSNVLAGITSAFTLFFSLKSLKRGKDCTPGVLPGFCLMSASALMLTFTVAAAFLAPMRVMAGKNYFGMFADDMFFFHFLNPALAAAALCLMDSRPLGKRDVLLAMVPTVIYSIVYFTTVVVLKVWPDFYNFTLGGRYAFIPLVVAVIYLLTLCAALLLKALHNRLCRS